MDEQQQIKDDMTAGLARGFSWTFAVTAVGCAGLTIYDLIYHRCLPRLAIYLAVVFGSVGKFFELRKVAEKQQSKEDARRGVKPPAPNPDAPPQSN